MAEVQQQYYCIADAASYIGRTVTALRHLVSRRAIRHYRTADNRIQLAREDLDAFVKAVVVEPKVGVAASVSVSSRTADGREVGDSAEELRRLSREVKRRQP